MKTESVMLFLKTLAESGFHTDYYSKINMQSQPQARGVAAISVKLWQALHERLA